MEVIIIKAEGKAVGWEMKGENPEEIEKLRIIRELEFLGINETEVVYRGRRESDDKNNNPGILCWIQRKFIKH